MTAVDFPVHTAGERGPMNARLAGIRVALAALAALAVVFAPAYPPAGFSPPDLEPVGEALGPRILAPLAVDAVAVEGRPIGWPKIADQIGPATAAAFVLLPVDAGRAIVAALASQPKPQTFGFGAGSRGPPTGRPTTKR